jgi:hypothetical protein
MALGTRLAGRLLVIWWISSPSRDLSINQPRTQDLSLGKTLAAAGHVPHQKFSARGGVGKVSNYINMLPVGYSLKTEILRIITFKILANFCLFSLL